MALRPSWITPSGSLGTFVQSVAIDTIQLQVLNAEKVTLISKSLPNGLRLDSVSKTISGTPVDIGITKTYDFVLRASIVDANGITYVQDRTFNITIKSEVAPILLTPAGTLPIGLNDENFVLNGSTINFQFNASSLTVPAGQTLRFYLEEGLGELPPGLKLSEKGLLYGTINDDLELDYQLVQGTYDRDYYDVNPYDYGSPIEPATAVTTVLNGKVVKADVTYGGNGYLLDPAVIVGGNVDPSSINITSPGSNYTTAPRVVFSTSPVSGGITAEGYALMSGVPGSLQVSSIVVTNQGTGYTTPPTITFKDQNTGAGAAATCQLKSGANAELVARVSNGTVVRVDVVNQGTGYSSPPVISFGLPTAGSRIISKTYKFGVTVSNGSLFDTKIYTILVKSEDSLRVDTTFISSDSQEFDSSRTYIQAPIWISPSTLNLVKGDNNYTYDLEVFDPTPQTGKLYFSLMEHNFDGTVSQLGPANEERNQITHNIIKVDLSTPVLITFDKDHTFTTGERVYVSDVGGSVELNGNVFYAKSVNSKQISLFSDVALVNEVDGRSVSAYTSGGIIRPKATFLSLDPIGGEISGFIPYQPAVTKTYTFTVKVQRILDDEEVASDFKQFNLVVEGNIEGDINFVSPTVIGNLKPNEQSLLEVTAKSTLPSASVIYEVVPGYGRTSDVQYVELNLKESNGNILIDGYGLNPVITFEKGQSYKLNVNLTNFTVSFRTVDGGYYNTGIRHSSGGVGVTAQEKSSGYYLFTPAFDETTTIKLFYTNTQNNGMSLALKKYNIDTKEWDRSIIKSYFNEYDAYTNNKRDIDAGKDVFAVFLNYTKIEFEIKKYNTATLTWQLQNFSTTKPINPLVNNYWLDLSSSILGVLDFRYSGLKGSWTPITYSLVTSMPSNTVGSNNEYRLLNVNGKFSVIRKINNVWKIIEILDYNRKSSYDPNVFFRPHTATTPTTNIQYDVWFKYTCLFDGLDKEIIATLKTLDNLPTDLSVSLSGEIIGKITPNTGNTYKSYYTGNTLYLVNDVVTFKDSTYICTTQHRSSGNWYQDNVNWSAFVYTKRTSTTIDVNSYGVGKFSVHGTSGDDGTTIDQLFRFRIRAKDTQNVAFAEKDFNIVYEIESNVNLTNIYLQPFLSKASRNDYFNFITDTTIFLQDSMYRIEDPSFGIQRIPKMLLLGGIENTSAERYASAVQRNYYDRPLYFGDLKVAIAKNDGVLEYEVIYVEIVDPSEYGDKSVAQSIELGFEYDPLTADYSKIRVDTNGTVLTDTGLDTIYPSSITLMQNELKNVTLQKTESVLLTPDYDDWGSIVGSASIFDNWGLVSERVALEEDFLSLTQTVQNDDRYRPLWMNTSQDGTGNPIGFVKAVPICYVKPGESSKIVKLIQRSGFDFKNLNFTIDRIIIQSPQGETGDKYIKFINREII